MRRGFQISIARDKTVRCCLVVPNRAMVLLYVRVWVCTIQVSEIDLKVGLLPGLPMALKGTVVTKARLNPTR